MVSVKEIPMPGQERCRAVSFFKGFELAKSCDCTHREQRTVFSDTEMDVGEIVVEGLILSQPGRRLRQALDSFYVVVLLDIAETAPFPPILRSIACRYRCGFMASITHDSLA